jgi:hypothetical protein
MNQVELNLSDKGIACRFNNFYYASLHKTQPKKTELKRKPDSDLNPTEKRKKFE